MCVCVKTSERWRARELTPACPGHVDDVGASSCGRTIIQRATRVDGGSDGGRGRWTLDGGCWMVDAAGGMAVHEVVDFTRSIAEPAAPPPCARAQTRVPRVVVFPNKFDRGGMVLCLSKYFYAYARKSRRRRRRIKTR